MKEMLQFMARYNRDANNAMMDVLKNVSQENLSKKNGLYYGSILGTFEHNLAGDIIIFGGSLKDYCKNPEAINDPVIHCATPEWSIKPEAKKDLATLFDTRRKMDEVILKITDDVEDLNQIAIFEFPGITFKKPRYQMIMSMLTHSTHHRGQIAAALDTMKIDNDFAGMLGTK